MRNVKIWYSSYELLPAKQLNRLSPEPRLGFLLRLQTKDFAAGYADCHPWAGFGDGTVKTQLENLRHMDLNPLLKRSLFFAATDGIAREEKKSLFDPKIKIKNHYTCVDIEDLSAEFLGSLAARGYKTIKIKAGRDTKREAEICNALPRHITELFSWRLDFNGSGGSKFIEFIKPSFMTRIDLVEDPEPFDIAVWSTLSRVYNLPIAFDHPPSAPVGIKYNGPRVIKPARQPQLARRNDIITSSMDHPVGQSFAFLQAQISVQKIKTQHRDYGLKTEHLFKSTPYFNEIEDMSPFFKPSNGYGIGFNELLESEAWIRL